MATVSNGSCPSMALGLGLPEGLHLQLRKACLNGYQVIHGLLHGTIPAEHIPANAIMQLVPPSASLPPCSSDSTPSGLPCPWLVAPALFPTWHSLPTWWWGPGSLLDPSAQSCMYRLNPAPQQPHFVTPAACCSCRSCRTCGPPHGSAPQSVHGSHCTAR